MLWFGVSAAARARTAWDHRLRGAGRTRRPADRLLRSAGRLGMPWRHRAYELRSVLDLADRRARGDRRADLRGQALDGAGPVGVERLLHLHGFEDDDQVALL